MHQEAAPQLTHRVLALVKRTMDALGHLNVASLNANGVFHHPATQLASLKAARVHLDKAIAIMERKWGT